MRLSELLGGNGERGGIEILGLAADSRDVRPGFLFAAIAGSCADGSDFIPDALAHGAAAILGPPGVAVPEGRVPLVIDKNPRLRLARLAARFFAPQPETVIAVTGTNGKTSVVEFARQLWMRLGNKAASLGTLGVKGADLGVRFPHTTPDPVMLHRTLKALAEDGVDHLAIEASSHGLDQYRLHGVTLEAAAFTNLTRDHLDYHASAEEYLVAKLRLFGEILAPSGTAVVNADDPAAPEIENVAWARGIRVLSVGRAGRDVRLLDLRPDPAGQIISIEAFGRAHELLLPLAGDFQALNALISAALVSATGAPFGRVMDELEHLEGVPGRLERIAELPNGAEIYVDYAHTPDALEHVLGALRPHARGRLAVVFGCGGERDRVKRAEMGAIAHRLADLVIVTDDNPRGEDAALIRAEIVSACPGAHEIGDRARAIRAGIGGLAAGDILVVAGKGHEEGQIIGTETIPFNDAREIRAALSSGPSAGGYA